MPLKVLFLCVHNSARSQMAEAYLKKFAGDKFDVESAGLEPGTLNPYVVEVLKEDGIDISNNKTKDVYDFFHQGKMFSYVITVCDETNAEKCPIFPGVIHKIVWDIPDPSKYTGSHDEIISRTRTVRDIIKSAVQKFVHDTDNVLVHRKM
ncbi:MAG: arsenate reductase ArsC, partial [Bacteroidetes bacterium]|nr:arsenate reductase ArsC [Bacteroidota bacterium]